MSHLLVLGGGWVGSAVARAASGLSPVTVIDPPLDPVLAPRDAASAVALRELLRSTGAAAVVNACGRVGGTDDELEDANVAFPTWLCEVLEGSDLRLVHVGSASEYGDPGSDHPVAEDAPVRARGAYAETKAAGSAAVRAARAAGLDAVVARVFNLVGSPIPSASPVHSWIEELRHLGPAGGEVEVWWPATQRDFVAVDDAGRALVELAGSGERPEIVNVCSGVAVGFGDIVEALARRLDVPATVRSLERPGIAAVVGDPSLLVQLLGWRPVMSADRVAELVVDAPVPPGETGSATR